MSTKKQNDNLSLKMLINKINKHNIKDDIDIDLNKLIYKIKNTNIRIPKKKFVKPKPKTLFLDYDIKSIILNKKTKKSKNSLKNNYKINVNGY